MAAGALTNASSASVAPTTTSTSWLQPVEAGFFEEDDEANREQAERNAKMRDRLRGQRAAKASKPFGCNLVPEESPEAFMAVTVAAAGSGSRPVVDENQPPWFVMRPHIENSVLRLHEEILDFMDFMKHTPEEVTARRGWVQTISVACTALWPTARVRVFGSFFTGLSLPNGDVDMAVMGVPCKPPTAMKMLADHLLANGEVSWLEIIESAKVPVCKLRSQLCGLRADVVFEQPDGIETSKFIRARIKEFPQMKPLLVFLKYFLMQRGLHETFTGGMGSYLLCNVVLHFLQRHPARLNAKQYATTSLGHLLFDFLKYYGQEFKYETKGISVNDGGSLFDRAERPDKGKGKGKDKGKGKKGGVTICLDSPFTPGADLGGACFRMAVLRNLFHHGFHCLCHLFVTRSGAEVSMLCPLLLDPQHPVITDRYRLMAEQPVALAGLPRAADAAFAALSSSRATEASDPTLSGEEDETLECAGGDEDGDAAQPASKRSRQS